MTRLISQLTLDSDAAIDLHMHTTYSDGRWPAQELIDFLAAQGFALVAVTDHDRVDMVASIQDMAAEKNLPVLSGVEMSTDWKGHMGHILCYGFDPENNDLQGLIERIARERLENTYAVYDELLRRGYTFPRQEEILVGKGGKLQTLGDIIKLLREHGYAPDWQSGLNIAHEAGFRQVQATMEETVDAAHRSGAVCLIAHPGRRERGFTFYDPALLDQVRAEIPIDGIEVYHPYHSTEIIETYLEYVGKHNLLLSTGSDSHCVPGRMPIKYAASTSRQLLERLGIHVA